MDSSLVVVLEDIRRKLEKSSIEKSKKEKFKTDLNNLIENYRNIGTPDNHKDTYDSLVRKGRELGKEANINDKKKVEYYLRYCNAALFDFNENLKPLNRLILGFMLTCILFFALSPQYFSFVLPLIMIIPVYMGLRGMRNRTYNGFLYAMSCIPMALLTSAAWIRNAFMGPKNFQVFVEALAKQYGRTPESARGLLIFFIILGFVLLISSIYTIVMGYKYRKMFV